MKVDVVIPFYRQEQHLPDVLRALEANAEQINRVIFVNDEETPRPALPSILDILWLDHPHTAFGLSKSANQGIAAATTDYVLLIEGDELLAPGALAEMFTFLTSDIRLMAGRKRYLDPVALQDGEHKFIEEDHRLNLMQDPKWEASRPWVFFSGGNLLIHRESHLQISGFNEEYGYGFHDYDYACRMMLAFGRDCCRFGVGEVWHIGSGKGRAQPGPNEARLFAETAAKLMHHRYDLMGSRDNPAWSLHCSPSPPADVWPLNMQTLDFIPDGTAADIYCSPAFLALHAHDFSALAERLARKVRPGGVIIAPACDGLISGIDLAGLEIDSLRPLLEISKPEDDHA